MKPSLENPGSRNVLRDTNPRANTSDSDIRPTIRPVSVNTGTG
jgi:hypothetical protein